MHNKLKNRIITERITQHSELSETEHRMVEASLELLALIAENRSLLTAHSVASTAAPPRLSMLKAAMTRPVDESRETPMTIFERLFAGRRPLVQFGMATLMLAVFCVGFLGYMARNSAPAWSQTDGSVLEYRLGTLTGEDALQPLLDQYIAKISEAKAELGGADSEQKTVQISVNVNAESDSPDVEPVPVATLVVSLLEDNPELLALIQVKIAEIPGTPVANVQSATWFYGPEGPGQGGIRFMVEGQVFNFPDTASEEEVEGQIRSWLAEHRPGVEYVVDITIERDSDAEGRERVRVMADIHEVGEESHKAEAEVKAPTSSR